jgi:hypothetical protein
MRYVVSLSRPDVVGVGVGSSRHALAVCARDGQWRIHAATSASLSSAALARSIDSLLADSGITRMNFNVVLTPDSSLEWVMNVPAGVQSFEELRRVAAARFAQLYGLATDDWTITADWRVRGPMLCAATPTALLDTLQSALSRHTSRVCVSTTLCSVLTDAQALPDDTWLGIRTPERLLLVLIRGRRPWMLRTLAITAPDLFQQLSQLVAEAKRSILRCGLAPAARILLYDCVSQPVGETQVDGIQIAPLHTPTLRRLDVVPRDSDSTVAACMGAVL